MATLHVQVSDEIMAEARRLAVRDHVPLDDLVVRAIAHNLDERTRSAEARAERGRSVDIRALMAMVPDVPPVPGDEVE